MGLFKTFSFDAVILIVFAFFLFMGIYFGIRRQFGLVLRLALPPVILYFLFDEFLKLHEKTKGFLKIRADGYLASALFVYIVAYLLMFFAIGLIYGIFKPPVKTRIMKEPGLFSRLAGGAAGLISAYFTSLLLVFFLKPVLGFNFSTPLTKVLVATDNSVFTLSKLNRHQYVNVDEYLEYDEALDLFTGKSALDFYRKTEAAISSLPELEQEIGTILPLLSQASRNLAGSGTLEELARKEGGKRVYQSILELEKNNENYPLIKEKLQQLHENRAYLLIRELLPGPLDFPSLMAVVSENLASILSEFPGVEEKKAFESGHAAGLYFQENGARFRELLPQAGTELEEHVEAFAGLLAGDPSEYMEAFLEGHSADFPELAKVFRKYLKHKDELANLPKNLSLAAKLALVERGKNWFENPLWEKHSLLRYHFFEALTSPDNRGHELYSEYFFRNYLATEDYYGFGAEEFRACLDELQELVEDGLLPEAVARIYVRNLLLEDSFLRESVAENLSDILALEHAYLSAELKAELAKRG